MIIKNKSIIKTISIKDLYVNEKLQREMRAAPIKQIVDKFNPNALGRILCNYRDSKYIIIDGQHRVCALRELGYKTVECNVYNDLSEVEEAEIYKLMANASLHSKYEKFKAELVIGDKLAIDINNTINSTGLKLGQRKKGKTIACINEISKCYKEDKNIMTKALYLIMDKFDLRSGITGVELRGMFLFLKKASDSSNFDYSFFQKRLEQKSQSQVLKLGSTHKEANYTTPAKGYALALLTIYNHNKKETNRMSLDVLN